MRCLEPSACPVRDRSLATRLSYTSRARIAPECAHVRACSIWFVLSSVVGHADPCAPVRNVPRGLLANQPERVAFMTMDPVFAVIARHREAARLYEDVSERLSRIPDVLHTEAEGETLRRRTRAEVTAVNRLFDVRPTTLTGLHALLAHMATDSVLTAMSDAIDGGDNPLAAIVSAPVFWPPVTNTAAPAPEKKTNLLRAAEEAFRKRAEDIEGAYPGHVILLAIGSSFAFPTSSADLMEMCGFSGERIGCFFVTGDGEEAGWRLNENELVRAGYSVAVLTYREPSAGEAIGDFALLRTVTPAATNADQVQKLVALYSGLSECLQAIDPAVETAKLNILICREGVLDLLRDLTRFADPVVAAANRSCPIDAAAATTEMEARI